MQLPPGSGWNEVTVAGVPVAIVPPATSSKDACLGSVLILRDEQPTEGDLISLATTLRAQSLAGLMPLPPSRWLNRPDVSYAGFSTPLRFLIDAVLPWVKQNWPEPAHRFAAVGEGFGGQGALQLAYRFPSDVGIVAAISPTIDFHRLYTQSPELEQLFVSQEAARQETATLNLHPINWPPHQWFACPRSDWRHDGCERLASKLTSIGIPFTAELAAQSTGSADSQQVWSRALAFIGERFKEPPTTREIRFGRPK